MHWILHTRITIASFIFQPAEKTLRDPANASTLGLSEQCSLVLQFLCLAPNTYVSRETLIESIWGENFETGNKGLNQVIWQLRKAIENLVTDNEENSETIIRLPRRGYQLNRDITFAWRYADTPPIHDTLQRQQDHIYVGDKRLALSEPAQSLLQHLPTNTREVSLKTLSERTALNIQTLWEHIGELQYELNQHVEGLQFVRQWNTQSLSLYSPIADLTEEPTIHRDAREQESSTTIDTPTAHVSPAPQKKLKRLHGLTLLLCSSVVMNGLLWLKPNWLSDETVAVTPKYLEDQLTELTTIKDKKGEVSMTDYIDASTRALSQSEADNSTSLLEQAEMWLLISKLNLKYHRIALAERQIYKAKQKHAAANASTQASKLLHLKIIIQNIKYFLETTERGKALLLIEQYIDNPTLSGLENYSEYVWLTALKASMLNGQGKFQESLLLIKSILEQINEWPGTTKTNELRSYVLNLQVIAYRQLNQLDNAIQTLQQLLAVEIEQHGEQHDTAISRYLSLGVIHLFKGNPEQSLAYFERAIKLNQRIYGDESNSLPLLLNNYSYALFEAGHYDKALSTIDKAIAIQEAYLGANHGRHALLYLTKSTHLLNIGHFKDAEKYNRISLALFEHDENLTHPFRGRAMEIAAHLFRHKNNFIDCEGYMRMAQRLYESSFPDDSHWIRQTAEISELSCHLLKDDDGKIRERLTELVNRFTDEFGSHSLPSSQLTHKLKLTVIH